MTQNVRVTFRDMDASPAVRSLIEERASHLHTFDEHVADLHAVVDMEDRLHHGVRLHVTTRGARLEAHAKQAEPGDAILKTVGEAFHSMERQLRKHAQKKRGR
ncbi:MAG: hypothetical protein GXP55_00705 [Deltaproteobacteria bacterium]|nr:hypothetical protein [Deltaproteobacteria bacterium]